MEEEEKQIEQSFTFVISKSDMEIILTGLAELPAKYSHMLINKLEMAMVAQIQQDKQPDKNEKS